MCDLTSSELIMAPNWVRSGVKVFAAWNPVAMLPVFQESWGEPSGEGTAVGSTIAGNADVPVGAGSVVVETAGEKAASRSKPDRRAVSN